MFTGATAKTGLGAAMGLKMDSPIQETKRPGIGYPGFVKPSTSHGVMIPYDYQDPYGPMLRSNTLDGKVDSWLRAQPIKQLEPAARVLAKYPAFGDKPDFKNLLNGTNQPMQVAEQNSSRSSSISDSASRVAKPILPDGDAVNAKSRSGGASSSRSSQNGTNQPPSGAELDGLSHHSFYGQATPTESLISNMYDFYKLTSEYPKPITTNAQHQKFSPAQWGIAPRPRP